MINKHVTQTLDVHFARKHFPSLSNNFVFMDNAGGSQTLGSVIDSISKYLTHYNVQLGASYKVSAQAGEKLDQVVSEMAGLINAPMNEEVIIGPSSTMLLRILSICLSREWQKGDEVIITNSDHEANVSCWMDLQKQGINIKTWKINPDTHEFELGHLEKLLSNKTKLVAMVHASNILGTINPIKEIAKLVHSAGALFCVDGVAFAPHRLVDVQAFDVDFYVYSFYKTFGPHLAVMYGKFELLRELDGLNHYFIGKEEVPYKFQPGNFNYELTYGLDGIFSYLISLHDHHYPKEKDVPKNEKYRKGFELISDHEQFLAGRLLDFLKTKSEIRIIGSTSDDKKKRVSTISFVHKKLKSSEVVSKVDKYDIGIRFGDFYAKKIIHDLGLIEKDGVIRVSLVHYNTIEEVEKLIVAFEDIF